MYWKRDDAVEQAAQRGCAVRWLENIQYPTQHGPEKPALGIPALSLNETIL